MKIAYIILHYMADRDTIECAESVLKATEKSEHETLIIIVDNGSPNSSYRQICTFFSDIGKIITIHSDENIGFAKGNNLGFCYAKYNWKADFIVQLNNDTIVSQADFNERLVKKYKERPYAVLGPDIITTDGYHQNPVPKKLFNHKELKMYRFKKYIKIFCLYLNIEKRIRNKVSIQQKTYSKTVQNGEIENAFLHGSCLVFSRDYIKVFDGMDPRTFLYWEEDILMLKIYRSNLNSVYSGELSILHKEDVATSMIHTSDKRKDIWVERQLIKSSRIYEHVLTEMEKEEKKYHENRMDAEKDN